tara:strand:- start:319 stop:525 length:207 start_codon:yes stop_codon:yes gene_type:complete
MQPDIIREQIRAAIVKGADSHRIVERIVAWCKLNCTSMVAKHAATSQTMAVLKLSPSQAEAVVSEFLV